MVVHGETGRQERSQVHSSAPACLSYIPALRILINIPGIYDRIVRGAAAHLLSKAVLCCCRRCGANPIRQGVQASSRRRRYVDFCR